MNAFYGWSRMRICTSLFIFSHILILELVKMKRWTNISVIMFTILSLLHSENYARCNALHCFLTPAWLAFSSCAVLVKSNVSCTECVWSTFHQHSKKARHYNADRSIGTGRSKVACWMNSPSLFTSLPGVDKLKKSSPYLSLSITNPASFTFNYNYGLRR